MSTILQRPDNPGTYLTLVGENTVRPPASVATVVAVPIVHDWGPLGKDTGAQLVEVFGNFDATFGNSPTVGRDAVTGAFVGPGIAGLPGAGGVLVYRMATAEAAAATKTVKNTAGSPEDALVLTGIYKGTRGNRISYVIGADPSDEAKARLLIRLDGVIQERYSYLKTNVAELATAINSRSQLVKAESKKTGTALATTTGTSLAGGLNGEAVTATEWSEAMTAMEQHDFSVFAPFDLVAPEIIAMVKSWTETQAENQVPIFTLLGGAGDEELEEAISEVEDIRDEHIIRIAGGEFHDDFLDKNLSTSKLAPRVAGALAGLGEEGSLTFCAFAGLHPVGSVAVGTDELALAAEQGLTVFRRASRTDAELIVAKGVTTYTDETNPAKPYELFSDPRIVRVGDLFLRRMKEWGDANIVGPTRVIETTKVAVRQKLSKEIGDLKSRGLILAGGEDEPTFEVLDDAGPNLQDAIAFEFAFKFARTTNFLIGTGRVR